MTSRNAPSGGARGNDHTIAARTAGWALRLDRAGSRSVREAFHLVVAAQPLQRQGHGRHADRHRLADGQPLGVPLARLAWAVRRNIQDDVVVALDRPRQKLIDVFLAPVLDAIVLDPLV